MELAYIPLSEGQDGTGMDKNTGESEEGEPLPLEKLVEALEDVPDCVRVWTS
jgi:hypothetical protein